MLNLDSHILIHALNGSLRQREVRLLGGDRWSVSDIVLWEITTLARLGRVELDIESADFARALSRIHVWPIDLAVCRNLEKLDFKSDLADEIIAATSITHSVPLVTRDRRILASKVVPFAGR